MIPIPLSFTEITRQNTPASSFSPFTVRTTSPFSVYLTALVIKLTIICFILISSPLRTAGSPGSTFTVNASPLSFILGCITSSMLRIMSFKRYSSSLILKTPDFIFEKSRMSFIRDKSNRPAVSIFPEYSAIFGSVVSRFIISLSPITVLMGVLSSWDMDDRKRLLLSASSSAATLSELSRWTSKKVLRTAPTESISIPRSIKLLLCL